MSRSAIPDTEASAEPLPLRVLAMVKRRAADIASATALLAALAAVGVMSIPPSYRSVATVVAQAEEVPADLGRSTLAEVARERIAVIAQQLLTRTTLLELVDKFDLYAAQRRYESSEEILVRMRKSISVVAGGAELADRPGGQLVNATIPFEIGFEASSPVVAQRVANALVALFIGEDAAKQAGAATIVAQAAGFDVPAGIGAGSARESSLAAELERAMQRFALIDPPQLPERPASPNRLQLFALGVLLSILGGFAYGAGRDRFDRTIRGGRDLARDREVPLLGVVPYVETAVEARARKVNGQSLALTAVGIVGLLALFVHYFVIELPFLWYIAAERFGF